MDYDTEILSLLVWEVHKLQGEVSVILDVPTDPRNKYFIDFECNPTYFRVNRVNVEYNPMDWTVFQKMDHKINFGISKLDDDYNADAFQKPNEVIKGIKEAAQKIVQLLLEK